MQPIYKIFVTIEKKFQDEIETESGLKLYKDTSFKPEENSTVVGIVAGVPSKTNPKAFSDDFQFNIKVGDKLYFNFLIVLDPVNMIEIDGKEYWMVDYFDAIALVRDSQIHPVGSYILIEPLEDEVTSDVLYIPDASKKVEGTRGKVWASNDPEIPVGCEVEYEDIGKFWNVIEGKKVYCMFNNNIMLKYNG